MKILSLDIKNIRGIKSITIEPEGQNLVISGPNGTGKSALVDAIDFLLTGSISRLTGKGAKFLRLKEHGPHIDSRDNLGNTIVIAKVDVNGKIVTLERSIKKSNILKIDPKKHRNLVENYLQSADLGLHILSRRDILNFITAEAGQRAKEVMTLLNLMDIEKLRTTLVTVRHDAETTFKFAESNLETAKSEIVNLLSLESFSEEACLNKVNDFRETLNAPRLSDLAPINIKANIEPCPFVAIEVLTPKQIENTINQTRSTIKSEELIGEVGALSHLLEEISKDVKLKQYLLYEKLLSTGIALLGDSNTCPLCEEEYGKGDLREFLEKRSCEMELTKEKQKKINEMSQSIKNKLDILINNINTALKAQTQFKIDTGYKKEIDNYITLLKTWSQAMVQPFDSFEKGELPATTIKELFSSPILEEAVLAPLGEAISKAGERFSKQLEAWDTLTKMEDKWEKYKQSLKEKNRLEKSKGRADALLDYFEDSRDSVLSGIYDEVRANFEQYYKAIHSDDESHFSSKIVPEEAELIFEVDFYGRGTFPPHALHSEGHQDSMGLCLFLALNNYLVKDSIKVVILDDVIMSIDRGHRRAIAALLKNGFPDRQFIITTHDTSWATELRSVGFVSTKNMKHFLNWNVDTGPIVEMERDLWDKIKEDLENNKAPLAAFTLRRNAECFFDDVCDFLRATNLPYTATHQWDLGEFATAAISTYLKYLQRAVVNAKKVDSQKGKELEELDKKSKEIILKSQIEQWAINRNVHYDRWQGFDRKDFEPVVEAFRSLFKLFICDRCNSIISRLDRAGAGPISMVTCSCQKVQWDIS